MEDEGRLTFSNKTYNRLKWLVMIVLPASSALYFGLGQIYNLYNPTNVVATIALFTTFLGTVLGISTKNYNKANLGDGQMVIKEDDEGKMFRLELDKTPDELEAMGRVTFKVIRENL